MEPFIYRAQCVRVVDGDTVDLLVDCGFRQYATLRFRLFGIDTPELNSKNDSERLKALEAKQYVIDALKPSTANLNGPWPLLVRTYKSDSFGRWLTDIFVGDSTVSLNQDLLKYGFATGFVP